MYVVYNLAPHQSLWAGQRVSAGMWASQARRKGRVPRSLSSHGVTEPHGPHSRGGSAGSAAPEWEDRDGADVWASRRGRPATPVRGSPAASATSSPSCTFLSYLRSVSTTPRLRAARGCYCVTCAVCDDRRL
jgi:uncharacterized protein YgiB involved in biofilm formation